MLVNWLIILRVQRCVYPKFKMFVPPIWLIKQGVSLRCRALERTYHLTTKSRTQACTVTKLRIDDVAALLLFVIVKLFFFF